MNDQLSVNIVQIMQQRSPTRISLFHLTCSTSNRKHPVLKVYNLVHSGRLLQGDVVTLIDAEFAQL